jgi:hypothetical protein
MNSEIERRTRIRSAIRALLANHRPSTFTRRHGKRPEPDPVKVTKVRPAGTRRRVPAGR